MKTLVVAAFAHIPTGTDVKITVELCAFYWFLITTRSFITISIPKDYCNAKKSNQLSTPNLYVSVDLQSLHSWKDCQFLYESRALKYSTLRSSHINNKSEYFATDEKRTVL